MKATVNTKDLREALQKVNSVARFKQLPVLDNTHITFSNGKAILTTTDMERMVKVTIDSTNTEQFSILLPRKTTEVFSQGNNGSISIETKDSKEISLSRDGLGSYNFIQDKVSDFPKTEYENTTSWHKIDAKWLCGMLQIIAVATAKEDSRPVLNGVLCSDGKMAAADGFRLASLIDKRLAFGLGDKQVIIPLDTVTLLLKLFRKVDEIEIAFEMQVASLDEPRRIHIKSGNVLLISELTQGSYPKWEQLIPSSFDCRVSFSVPLLLQRLNMMDEKMLYSGIVRYDFHHKEDTEEHECSISTKIEDTGNYSLTCPVKIETKDEGKIAFNYRYVIDAIKPFSMCNLELTSISSPGKFTGDIEGLIIVVMPMFVQW